MKSTLRCAFWWLIDIHHIFPDIAWKECYKSDLYDSVVNKTPLSSRTNKIIGSNAKCVFIPNSKQHSWQPRNAWMILRSHVIEPKLLRADDFYNFLLAHKKALLERIEKAMAIFITDVSVESENIEPFDFMKQTIRYDESLQKQPLESSPAASTNLGIWWFRPPPAIPSAAYIWARCFSSYAPQRWGKSICFQLPALLQNGLTLVVSPLVALMENPVKELRQIATFPPRLAEELPVLNGKLSSNWKDNNWDYFIRRQKHLPVNSLATSGTIQLKITGLIWMRAHCLRNGEILFTQLIGRFCAQYGLLKYKPAGTANSDVFLTATADPVAQKTIAQVLP